MRVCFFLGSVTGSGGTERVCLSLANALSRSGYEVCLVSLWGATPFFEIDRDIPIKVLYPVKKTFKLRYPQVVYRWRKALKELNPQVVIDVESTLCLYTACARRGLQIQHIVWEHFNFTVDLGLKIRRLSRVVAAKYAHKVVVLTQKDAEMWKNAIKLRADIKVIPNPVTQEIASADVSPLNEKCVLAVGRLTYQKGFDLLLTAWSQIALKASGWELVIIGDGEDREALVQQCHELGLAKTVRFVPTTRNIRQFYKQASIFCLSSRFEGLPMVLLEAQSFGLPAVSFDCPTGPDEIIKHGVNGLLVEPGNVNALAEALLALIHDQSKRTAMQKEALSVISRFKLETVIPQWRSVLARR